MSPGLRPSKTRTANPPPGEMGGYPLPEASAGREAFGDRLGPGRPRSSSLRPDSVHRIMAAQSVKGLAVILGALIAVAFTAGGASSAANRPSGATTSRPSTTSGLKQPAPQSARPTVAPCAASMTAIAHGTFAYVEPGQLFSPATGAPTPRAALQGMKEIARHGLIAVCPYINSVAASQIVQVLGAVVGTPLPTAAVTQLLHGTKSAPGEVLTIKSLSCGKTSCSGSVTITNSTGGSSTGAAGTTRINSRWFVTTYMTTTASN